jgi:hypothetical protein
MPLDFFMGKPQRNGEYVCNVQDRTQPEWTRPIILNWHDGKWYFPRSNNQYPSGVFGWTGPLPIGRLDDPFPPTVQEYSL